jgi:hypothetical protein
MDTDAFTFRNSPEGFRDAPPRIFLCAFAVPEPIGPKSDMQQFGNTGKNALDYVTRTFQRIFGTAE